MPNLAAIPGSATIEIFARLQLRRINPLLHTRSATIEIFARLQQELGINYLFSCSATIEIFARLQPLFPL